jgi:hypothetical protein
MNKEQQELLDEAYKNYSIVAGMSTQVESLKKEEFINKCKTDTEFSERWGLKIEERELITQERNKWHVKYRCGGNRRGCKNDWKEHELNQQGIPTKLITITYNDTKLESYE